MFFSLECGKNESCEKESANLSPKKNLASWLVPHKFVEFEQATLPQEALS
jgi:hypothetical protein